MMKSIFRPPKLQFYSLIQTRMVEIALLDLNNVKPKFKILILTYIFFVRNIILISFLYF